MILEICENCEHGSIKNGISHCGKASIYSHLTNCLREKAMEEFLERQGAREDAGQVVGVAL